MESKLEGSCRVKNTFSPCHDCRKSSHDKTKALMSKFIFVLLAYKLAIGLSYKSHTRVVWNRNLFKS